MTRTTPSLLLLEPAEGAVAVQKSKTHFEQISLELVKKIAKGEVPADNLDENDSAVTTNSSWQREGPSHAFAAKKPKEPLAMQLPVQEINCSICNKPVSLESARTDEAGRAVHQECYLLSVATKTGRDSVHRAITNAERKYSTESQRQR